MSGDGKLVPLNITPGLNKDVTEYAAEGCWTSCNNVRFRDGKAEKWGGSVHEQVMRFTDATDETFPGVARDILIWSDFDLNNYIALGTTESLTLKSGGLYYDITPVVQSFPSISDRLTTSIGSTEVLVSVTSHPGRAGDYVVFSSLAATVGGNIYLNGQYAIVTAPSPSTFVVDSGTTAVATSTGAGGNVNVDFLLPTGRQSNGSLIGWGAGTWGAGTWGVGASSSPGSAQLTQWSLDSYGADLIANRRGDGLYRWSAASGPLVRAAVVTAAPTIIDQIKVHSPSGHTIAFGCTDLNGDYNPLLVRWSDQNDINTWTPTVSNAAGDWTLFGGNRIMAVQPTRREILILTEAAAYTMTYTGDETVFSFEEIGESAGALSQHCAVDLDGVVYWISDGAFMRYDGRITILDTLIDKAIFRADSADSINLEQNEKIFGGANSLFNEIIWLYPSRDSEEIDSYIIYNKQDNIHYTGRIDRTVWADAAVLHKPYAASSEGILYVHEESYDNDGAALPVYLESAWFDIGDGDDLLFVDRFIPDIRRLNSKTLTITLEFKKYPESTETVTKGPYTITDTTGKISLRARGRQARVILEQNLIGGSFELGNNRLAVQPDGKR